MIDKEIVGLLHSSRQEVHKSWFILCAFRGHIRIFFSIRIWFIKNPEMRPAFNISTIHCSTYKISVQQYDLHSTHQRFNPQHINVTCLQYTKNLMWPSFSKSTNQCDLPSPTCLPSTHPQHIPLPGHPGHIYTHPHWK